MGSTKSTHPAGTQGPSLGDRCPQLKNHLLPRYHFKNLGVPYWKVLWTESLSPKIFWDLKKNLYIFFREKGVLSFWGRGTCPRSPTSGVRWHTVHYHYFRGWRADKNCFWTVSISTSGFELWGFENFGGIAIFGGKILESHSSEVVRSASVQRVLGVLKHIARSQIPGTRKLVKFAYENVEKTRKTR